jgi:hypothetical protein
MSQWRIVHIVGLLMLLVSLGLAGGWIIGRARVAPVVMANDPSPVVKPGELPAPPSASAPVLETPRPPAEPIRSTRFDNIAKMRGVEFNYMRGETGEYWLPETMGGGVGWVDFDGDGRLDLYCVQGCQLPSDETGRFSAVLYRNRGSAIWDEVPRSAGPANRGYGMGTVVGDVDNDGFDDIYVTNFGIDTFWHNEGDGTFTEGGVDAGLHSARWSTSAAFGDLDRDGDLDLFVGNYVEQNPAIVCVDPASGNRKYCGPDYYDGQPCDLFENGGNGQFSDVSVTAGVARSDGKALGVVIADLLLNDGVPEIFVANDLRPNFLYRQHGNALEFEEVGFALGAAVNAEGIREANMGIACADYDGDNDLDLYVTHYYMEHDTLWENQGGRGFADMTRRAGLSLPTLRQLSWGTNFIDYDNDGWLDLFVTSGHINDTGSGTIPYAMTPQLFHNQGAKGTPVRFTAVQGSAGNYFRQAYVGRASAAADFDRDGRIDLAVGHHHKPFALLHNRSEAASAIGFQLVGISSNRSAIGTRVTITFLDDSGTERRIMREVIGGGSYLAADSRELLFGIGNAEVVKSLEVRWPSGATSRHEGLKPGGYWVVREGKPVEEFTPFVGASANDMK